VDLLKGTFASGGGDPLVFYSLQRSGVFRTNTKLCPFSLLVTFLRHEYSFRAV